MRGADEEEELLEPGERALSSPSRRSQARPRSLIAALVVATGALVVCAIALLNCRSERAVECNVFLEPGFLDVQEPYERTRWRPIDEARCPSSHLSQEFRASMKDGSARRRFPWLVGRTAVKIGDSIDRNQVGDLCGSLGLAVEQFVPGTPNALPDWLGPDDRPRAPDTTELWREARPRRCRIDALDFELIDFFHYGLATAREFAAFDPGLVAMPHFFPPVALSDRIEHLVLPTLDKLGRKADLVEFSSTLWDCRFTQAAEDEFAKGSTLSLWTTAAERVRWYSTRLSTALDSVELAFPNAQLLWRRAHEIQFYLWFPASVERNVAFRSAADVELAKRARWRIDNYGTLLTGQQHHFIDGMHPSSNMSSIWLDILLFEFRRLGAHTSSL